VILALTACKDYELEQLDVKTTFLHGDLKEVIYIRKPLGYEQGNKAEIGSTKSLLKKEFEMKELGEANKILGREIIRDWSCKILRVTQFGPFKTLCFFDYALMIRQDYDITSSLRRGALQKVFKSLGAICKCGWELDVLDGVHEARHSVRGLVYGTDYGNHVNVIGFVDSDYAKNLDKCRLHWNEVSPSPSLLEPVIKQLEIKLVDEYGFVIRPSLVRLTSKSCEDRPVIRTSQSRQHDKGESVSLGCSGNTTRIMRMTLMVTLVFTLCEEQVIWNNVLMKLIDDLLALDLIVRFGFSDRRLERTATFSISTNSE
nr:zinc finger, CCHC-type [Tanacetum cinerariifolium]